MTVTSAMVDAMAATTAGFANSAVPRAGMRTICAWSITT